MSKINKELGLKAKRKKIYEMLFDMNRPKAKIISTKEAKEISLEERNKMEIFHDTNLFGIAFEQNAFFRDLMQPTIELSKLQRGTTGFGMKLNNVPTPIARASPSRKTIRKTIKNLI